MKAAAMFALLIAATAPARAQNVIISIEQDGTIKGDWSYVTQCALKPYPVANKEDPKTNRIADHYFQTISRCRLMLAARHAGWIAAGREAGADPYPPVAMTRIKEDFETELVCDYSKLDANGNGAVHCNAGIDP